MGYGYTILHFRDSADTFMELQELASHINYGKLPHDCVAAAAQRIRESYSRKGFINARDWYIVFGNPCEGVCFPTNEEEAKKQLEEIVLRRKESLRRLGITQD